jgi:hypothetical protein
MVMYLLMSAFHWLCGLKLVPRRHRLRPNLQHCEPEAFPGRSSQQDPTRRAADPLLPWARVCA